MPNKKYSEYIEISPTFESVVDIGADSRNANLWREYIVGEDMTKMIEALCKSLNNEEPDSRRSFWIEGTYGTGKSYAAIFIKHLIEEPPEVVDSFLNKNLRLGQYRNRFMKCRAKDKGDYLVIWKTGCTGIYDGNSLLIEVEMAVRKALADKFGDKADYGEDSLHAAVMRQVNNPILNWQSILEKSILRDDYESFDVLRRRLEEGDLCALRKTAAVIRKNNLGLIDSLETFKNWISSVIKNNGLSKSGIFFIWDEFTEYVANSDDHTILQQLSEFCKIQPFFMLFVVHRTTQMVERITTERYQLIAHRFHQIEFHISTDAAFDLIEGSINIRNGVADHWKDARRGPVNNIRQFLTDMADVDDKICEKIEKLCPMHPMTIKLLSRVAENYAASQRTMFRFMKDQANPVHGFVRYINKEGPESQACWLTPEWLWSYFFTCESDFSDKETKAAEYIRHYEENRKLVENDENAHRVFKTAMLLLALMSSAKGIYSGRRAKDGIAATKECLETCLAGVMSKAQIEDMLKTMVDSKILVLDEGANNIVRIQLPFRSAQDSDFTAKLAENDKKHSRYMMFCKDGVFAQAFEKQSWNENDAALRRMKIAVCCAETNSVKNRLGEIKKELEKYPYKLGLLIVTVQCEAQAVSIQTSLQSRSAEENEERLIIALVKAPLTDEIRKKWLTAITKQEMASEAGQTGSVQQYKNEASLIVASWVTHTVSGGKIVVYNGSSIFNNVYGITHLQTVIHNNVQNVIFKYAPENIVLTNTAYRPCSIASSLAGVYRKSANNQFANVLNLLKSANILNLNTIEEIINAKSNGSKPAECVAMLAELVKNKMESGHVTLSELWADLQKKPFGYYNNITCSILLGFVFSCYKNSKYTWIDESNGSHVLDEETIGTMVAKICNGKTESGYLSAGSIVWQNFSDYLSKIFKLSAADLADENKGFQNVREAVVNIGSPFWVLKYLADNEFGSKELKGQAHKIIDKIQEFIAQQGDRNDVMNTTLELFKGQGKIRVILEKAFQDKSTMTAAFRTFLFEASPELKKAAERLAIQPEELSDRLHSVMQSAIYTWKEEQVKEKLANVVEQYKFIEAIGKVLGKTYKSIEAEKKDLLNLFNFLKIPMKVIESLNKPWFYALKVLYRVAFSDTAHMPQNEREDAILALEQHGVAAKDCLQDSKPVLEDILKKQNIEYTKKELETVYNGLKDVNCNTTNIQFENILDKQIDKIKFERNKHKLLDMWRSISGKDSIKEWCNAYNVPLMWIIPKELYNVFCTLLNVQQGVNTAHKDIINAINALANIDTGILTDKGQIDRAFLNLIGQEFLPLWQESKSDVMRDAKYKFGNDMSSWRMHDFSGLQDMLKKKQKEKAKHEKLAGTKNDVSTMQESDLRKRVIAFLDAHPEFCDDFAK